MEFDVFMIHHLIEINNYIIDILERKTIAIFTHYTHVQIDIKKKETNLHVFYMIRYRKSNKKLSKPTKLRHCFTILMSTSVVTFKVLNEN